MRLGYAVPLGVFLLLLIVLGIGLSLDPSKVPSPLIDKAAPEFTLTDLHDAGRTLSNKDQLGKVWLLNVWASWCVSCRQEHPLLLELARQGVVPIYGLNYKDQRPDALAWLQQLGNPYVRSAYDDEGKVGMDYGVYGVPETYVIDRQGTIRYKQIGPVSPEVLRDKILPLVKELQG